MNDVVFRVLSEHPGHLEAQADAPALRISAPTLEELHHEAREALIQQLGPVHAAYRVRIQRSKPAAASTIRPLQRPPLCCP